ncbi:MAG: cell division protein FtsL [Bacillota bacterium]|nr:cell division protein FtsL [Bacillota bacterium]
MLAATARVQAEACRSYATGYRPQPIRRVSRRRFRLHAMARVALLGLCLAALLLLYVGERALIIDRTYALQRLEKRLAELQVEQERLQLEISRLSSLERIEQVARFQLGMRESETVYYLAAAPPPREEEKGSGSEGQPAALARVGMWLQSVLSSAVEAAHD